MTVSSIIVLQHIIPIHQGSKIKYLFIKQCPSSSGTHFPKHLPLHQFHIQFTPYQSPANPALINDHYLKPSHRSKTPTAMKPYHHHISPISTRNPNPAVHDLGYYPQDINTEQQKQSLQPKPTPSQIISTTSNPSFYHTHPRRKTAKCQTPSNTSSHS